MEENVASSSRVSPLISLSSGTAEPKQCKIMSRNIFGNFFLWNILGKIKGRANSSQRRSTMCTLELYAVFNNILISSAISFPIESVGKAFPRDDRKIKANRERVQRYSEYFLFVSSSRHAHTNI